MVHDEKELSVNWRKSDELCATHLLPPTFVNKVCLGGNYQAFDVSVTKLVIKKEFHANKLKFLIKDLKKFFCMEVLCVFNSQYVSQNSVFHFSYHNYMP